MKQPAASSVSAPTETLCGKRFAVVGKLASISKKELAQYLRRADAVLLAKADATVDALIVGEESLLGDDSEQIRQQLLAEQPELATSVASGRLPTLTETQLRSMLGLDPATDQRWYTAPMLADLLDVKVSVIRRWTRLGLIRPVREVKRLAYYDFQQLSTARHLVTFLGQGLTAGQVARQLRELQRLLPPGTEALQHVSLQLEGKRLVLRQGSALLEAGGQRRFDFDDGQAESTAEVHAFPDTMTDEDDVIALPGRDDLESMALDLEEDGQLEEALEMYRAALAAGGPDAQLNFSLAELLYRLGEPAAARERYYAALEMDEDFIEARLSLGCVLSDAGQHDLAIAAIEGALRQHPDYPDAHFHLARILDDLGRRDESEHHWEAFLYCAPESPWADQARARLGLDDFLD